MADDLEQKYLALVERIRGYTMTETERAAILAEIERQYRAALEAVLKALHEAEA